MEADKAQTGQVRGGPRNERGGRHWRRIAACRARAERVVRGNSHLRPKEPREVPFSVQETEAREPRGLSQGRSR